MVIYWEDNNNVKEYEKMHTTITTQTLLLYKWCLLC